MLLAAEHVGVVKKQVFRLHSSCHSLIVILLSVPGGEHVSAIAIKTGNARDDGSSCRAVVEICDCQNNCCQTSPDGQNREVGQTDVFTNKTILGSCAQEVTDILTSIDVKLLNKLFPWPQPILGLGSIWLVKANYNKTTYIFCPQRSLVGDPITAKLTISHPNADDGDITPNLDPEIVQHWPNQIFTTSCVNYEIHYSLCKIRNRQSITSTFNNIQ